jgi:hypothetical protein
MGCSYNVFYLDVGEQRFGNCGGESRLTSKRISGFRLLHTDPDNVAVERSGTMIADASETIVHISYWHFTIISPADSVAT